MEDVTSMLRVGTRFAREGEYNQAVEKFFEAVQTATEDPRGWFGLGVCYVKLGDLLQGREALEEAVRLGHPKAQETLDKLSHFGSAKVSKKAGTEVIAARQPVAKAAAPAQKGAAKQETQGAQPAAAAAPAPEPAEEKIKLGKHVRVMLIEDKEEDREAITKALRECVEDIEMVETPFAQSASRTIVGLGIFDVAIMNWNTSPRDAKDLLEFLKLKQPHIPVIVLTYAWSERMAREVIRAGADYCMVKASGYARILPFVLEQRFKQSYAIQERIESELSGNRPFNSYMDAIDKMLILLDRDGQVLDVNQATQNLLHASRERLLGEKGERLFRLPPGQDSFFPLTQVFATGKAATVERCDPTLGKHFRVTTLPLHTDDRVEYLNVVEEITKVSAQEPKPEVSPLQALDSLDCQFFFKDAEGKLVHANPAYAQSLGCSVEDLVGHTEEEFVSDELAHKHQEDFESVLKSGEPRATEELQGGRWIAYEFVPVKGQDGALKGVAGLGRDVTEFKRAQGEDGADTLGKLAGMACDLVFDLDNEGKIAFVSSSATQPLGNVNGELDGTPFAELVRADAREEWGEMFRRVLGNGESIARRELPVRRQDGSYFYAAVSLTPMLAEDTGRVSGVRGVLNDVSLQKRLEAALAILKGEAPTD